MFKGRHFYHQHIRKAIIAFGTLFNGIQVRRRNEANEIVQSLFVPLSYAPKQKFIERIREAPEIDANRPGIQVTVPRIGFEITNFTYDPARKLAITQNVRAVDPELTNTGVRYSYVSTPYNMGIGMSVFTKNQDDGLQIIEQILPYFNPDFNITVNELPDLGVRRDLKIVLESVNYQDEWEGGFDKRLSVIWDLNFTVKMNLYGYVQDANLIKKSIQKVYTDNSLFEGGEPTNTLVGRRITNEVDPDSALPTESYNYITEFDDIYFGENE
jgi:hypothetical protein